MQISCCRGRTPCSRVIGCRRRGRRAPSWGRRGTRVKYHLVVVAASAGGLTALASVLEKLPREFPVPLGVVQHVDPNHQSLVASILDRHTSLKVQQAREHDSMIGGHVYVAPPGMHMVVGPGYP